MCLCVVGCSSSLWKLRVVIQAYSGEVFPFGGEYFDETFMVPRGDAWNARAGRGNALLFFSFVSILFFFFASVEIQRVLVVYSVDCHT